MLVESGSIGWEGGTVLRLGVRPRDTIKINEDIYVTLSKITAGKVVITIEAPQDVSIRLRKRPSVYDNTKANIPRTL